MPHQVLIYGHDSLLLRTREQVLQRAGFDVCTSEALDEATATLATRPVDLLILCHTVRSEERSQILAAAHTGQKKIAVLFLSADSQSLAVGENDSVFSTLDGPHSFLQTVCRLTHEPAPVSHISNPQNPGERICPSSQAQ